ncbi:MAG: response regulator transcription factor [Firmicutes bacterium]|nr:response regulator transcription factor [Bacillota bacterium]MBQ4504660.1 response regulator transcription factor [Bacillota bacterium]MBQ6684725.1 response regulator transcription factor [Bacillota bacterium]
MNILVCDDDKEIVGAIEIYLNNEGYQVYKAYDGLEALNVVEKEEIHLILMDIMMPKLDGMRATMRIREDKNIPIIMLSAKSEDYDKITGLNAGADDYITKPFNPLELVARVKSQLRRYTSLGSMEKRSGVYRSGGLVVDDEQKCVTLDGEQVPVTPIEYGILKLLTANAGKVFSMEQIYEAVWKEPAYNPENTVAVHVRRIREKIEINPKEPRYLKVVWGIGYKIEKHK